MTETQQELYEDMLRMALRMRAAAKEVTDREDVESLRKRFAWLMAEGAIYEAVKHAKIACE